MDGGFEGVGHGLVDGAAGAEAGATPLDSARTKTEASSSSTSGSKWILTAPTVAEALADD